MRILSSSITEVCQKLCSRDLTAVELLELCLRRADHVKQLNAFISVTGEMARRQASQSDQRHDTGGGRGALDGVPIAVKDNFCVSGAVSSCGSRMLADFRPPYTASVVSRLLDAGAVLLGKTNLDEFAMGVGTSDSHYGPTQNVWGSELQYSLDQQDGGEPVERAGPGDFFIPGGSSGGSAVAVASGACFGALGSDTGGSVRNPAASCGLVGLKPSYGLLSRHGLVPLVNSMDVPAILTRSVADATTMFNVMNAADVQDSTCVDDDRRPVTLVNSDALVNGDVSGLVIGLPVEYHCEGMQPDVLNAWDRTADMLVQAGATVKQVSMPHTQLSIACYSVLNCAEVASNMARYDGVQYGYRASTDRLQDGSLTSTDRLQDRHEVSTERLYADTRCQALSAVVRGRVLAGNYFLLRRQKRLQLFGHAQRRPSTPLAVMLASPPTEPLRRGGALRHTYRQQLEADVQRLGLTVASAAAVASDHRRWSSIIRQHYETYMMQAMRLRRLIQRDFVDAWRCGCHLLLTPVTMGDGVRHSEFVRRDSRSNTAALDLCTQPANMAGVPAISVPVCLSGRGLPIGLQLMAPLYQEQLLLNVAKWLEDRLQFPRLELL